MKENACNQKKTHLTSLFHRKFSTRMQHKSTWNAPRRAMHGVDPLLHYLVKIFEEEFFVNGISVVDDCPAAFQ
jgi:hypothetical protein